MAGGIEVRLRLRMQAHMCTEIGEGERNMKPSALNHHVEKWHGLIAKGGI